MTDAVVKGKTLSEPADRPNSITAGLRVADVSKRFGRFQALDSVSFEVPPGKVCTLLGPSGCGKTTMLRLLAGLERPDSGQIEINSQVVSSDRLFVPPESRRIGFVFQSYALWPHMTVYDHVAYPLRAQRFPRAQVRGMVERTIELVGLTREARRFPSELSGGQQQRVALARALVVEPTVLLLDEPLSNLDAALRQQMRVELLELHRRVQVTAIYVTHDQTEAMALSDMVIVMDAGHIIESGAPRAIYDYPQTAHTASFVGSANLLEGVILTPEGRYFSVRLTDGTVVQATSSTKHLRGAQVTVAIKPEDVLLLGPEDQTRRQVGGHVLTSVYLGTHVLLRVSAAGQELRVNVDKSTLLSPGEQVVMHLPPDRSFIFARDALAAAGNK
jgi:ABC-type Fe3+/spermidine/putrescine transport system ATPase subunit